MADSPFTPVADPVYTHHLETPIKAGAAEIGAIAIRKPTGLDLLEAGSPIVFDPFSGAAPSLNVANAYRMLSRLSNIPAAVLQRADVGEMIDLFWMISTFFTKGLQASLPEIEKQKASLATPAEQPAP